MGFTQPDTTLDGDGAHPTCLNYLKGLGVSHVQLQPIFDYAIVDETRPDGGYNWGYAPQTQCAGGQLCHGSVPRRGSRARVPRHGGSSPAPRGAGRYHGCGLQPTHYSESCLERTVPGYWNRRWPNDSMTNGSGCGCDLASSGPWCGNTSWDSILYWAQTYHIDGFRFDLMALE